MPNSENTREYPSGARLIAGVLMLPLAMLIFLSLVSYDWRDIGLLCTPSNSPPNNWIGAAGAWTAFALLTVAGIGAYAIPAWGLIAGLLLAFYRNPPGRKCGGSAVALILVAAILDLHGLFDLQATANITDNGGIIGWMLTHGLLIRWLSPLGTGVLLWSMLLLTLIMTIGWRSLVLSFRYTLTGIGLVSEQIARRRAEMSNQQRQLEKETRQLRRQQVRLEREMRKEKLAEEFRRREEPPGDSDRVDEGSRRGGGAPHAGLPARLKSPPSKPDTADDIYAATEDPLPAPVIDPEKSRFPGYALPPVTLLDAIETVSSKLGGGDNIATGARLIETLNEFSIAAEITSIKQGPVVTRYELLPARGVRVERIAALSNNLALALKAHSIRVQAPVPGKGVVGIEVPNDIANMVVIREMVESEEWKAGTARLPLALGKDVGGRNVIADLAKMPHLLVAGATGSGKSVCINAMLAGLFMAKTPDELRLILVDPKIVEFSIYNDLPHLVVPVITDPKKVALSLRWAITEMETRYKMFAKAKVRNIEGFNNRHTALQGELFGSDTLPPPSPADELPPSVPYVVIVIDELADLMLAAGAEIENSVARLAQLSRAVGIHMIIATQRPSVNIITGTIKANFPARIAFQVAQKVDSRTILDQSGADKLLGRGDMLFLPPASSKLVRAQGAMITDHEINRIVNHMKAQATPVFELEIKNKLDKSESAPDSMDDGVDDDLLAQAVEIIRETRRASTSSLQRRMRIGYTRAARLIDILEERGIVGPPRGAEPREILIDLDVDTDNTGGTGDFPNDEDMTDGDD